MNEFKTSLEPGQIRFHQWCEPPIEPGDYQLSLSQKVQELETDYQNELKFSVSGPRFSLDPADIYCVYPPDNTSGEYGNSLPHIVFTRRTLPWERSITGKLREKDDKRPWFALLVLDREDFVDKQFPLVKTRQLKELVEPEFEHEAEYYGPKVRLTTYEDPAELCQTIDLPGSLFQSIAPSMQDLDKLAHVREVNTDAKETLSYLADGWFSVAVGNRFSKVKSVNNTSKDVETRVYLVSLEGLADYLPDESEPRNKLAKPVRMAVLSSWCFFTGEANSFKIAMDEVETAPLSLTFLPEKAVEESHGTDTVEQENNAVKQVKDAFTQGYTGLNHSTRLGEKTVSWYRGPLVPLRLMEQSKFTHRSCPDAALRYDPDTGLMDVSYAAAMQLGRLLALQDRHFASLLYNFRNKIKGELQFRRELKKSISQLSQETEEQISVEDQAKQQVDVMRQYLTKLGKQSKPFYMSASVDNQPLIPTESMPKVKTADVDLTIPRAIINWLSKLLLLYCVPFNYLVANEQMLPTDTMRFFYIDPNWLKCLLEGACSLGSSDIHDNLIDQTLRDKFLDFALEHSLNIRTRQTDKSWKQIVSVKQGAELTIKTDAPHELGDGDMVEIAEIEPANSKLNGLHKVKIKDNTCFSIDIDSNVQDAKGGICIRHVTDIPINRQAETTLSWPLTGFLLRSSAVKHWQGVEMKAWSDSKQIKPLQALRIDRLAPDIMLCIFNGKVEHIEVKQPPEGMHFGASEKAGIYKKTTLRNLKAAEYHDETSSAQHSKQSLRPGQQINGSKLTVPLRADTDVGRVIDISALSERFKQNLGEHARPEFTSADFAVEMFESPARVIFDVNNPLKVNLE